MFLLFGRKTKRRRVAGGRTERRRCPECGESALFVEHERESKVTAYHFVELWSSDDHVFVCSACGEALGGVRKGSATERLVHALPGVPVFTVESAARLIDRSKVATGAAVNRLAEAGIVTQRNAGKARYRVFEATAVLDLFTGLERALASPSGDTASSPPARPAPRRP